MFRRVISAFFLFVFSVRVFAYDTTLSNIQIYNSGSSSWYGMIYFVLYWNNNSGGGGSWDMTGPNGGGYYSIQVTGPNAIPAGSTVNIGSVGGANWPLNTGFWNPNPSLMYHVGTGNPSTDVGIQSSGGGSVSGSTTTINGWLFTVSNSSCLTNAIFSLNNDTTNNITILVSSNGVAIPGWVDNVVGPLVNWPFEIPNVPCDALITVTFSNAPPCTEPLVFNAVNSSPNWRIFAVKYIVSPFQLLAQSMVAPSGTYFFTNNVPCGTAANYRLYATGPNGDDNLVDTGITNMAGSSMPTNSNLGDSIASGGGGGSGVPPSYPSPLLTNAPSDWSISNTFPLPLVNSFTNPLIWTDGGSNMLTGMPTDIKDSGQAVWQAVNQAAAQAHSDANGMTTQAHADAGSGQSQGVVNANGIIGAVNQFAQQNHADLSGLYSAVGVAGASAHLDSGAVVGAIGNLTNGLPKALTNYNLETTQVGVLGMLAGISNLLGAAIDTNALGVFDTNDIGGFDFLTNNSSLTIVQSTNYAQGQALLVQAKIDSGMTAVDSQIQSFVDSIVDFHFEENFAPVDMTYTFSIGGGGGAYISKGKGKGPVSAVDFSPSLTADFNPMHYSWFAALADNVKAFWVWIIAYFYIMRCVDDIQDAITLSGGAITLKGRPMLR